MGAAPGLQHRSNLGSAAPRPEGSGAESKASVLSPPAPFPRRMGGGPYDGGRVLFTHFEQRVNDCTRRSMVPLTLPKFVFHISD